MYNLFYNLPQDILNIINKHLAAIIIQDNFRSNRPMSPKRNGNRVVVMFKNKKKKYGTIYKITDNFINIEYLQQIIPNWKKSNIFYWKCFKCTFPYYTPKIACIKLNNFNIKIIKLHNWKSDLKIDSSIRIHEYYKK